MYSIEFEVIFAILWCPYNVMELISHFMTEHESSMNMSNISGKTTEIMIKVILYVSRAGIFLYFFIWPLNYFLRYPKLRRQLRLGKQSTNQSTLTSKVSGVSRNLVYLNGNVRSTDGSRKPSTTSTYVLTKPD